MRLELGRSMVFGICGNFVRAVGDGLVAQKFAPLRLCTDSLQRGGSVGSDCRQDLVAHKTGRS